MKVARLALLLILTILGLGRDAQAHESNMSYLRLQELEDGSFDIVFKEPASGRTPLGLDVNLPADASITRDKDSRFITGAHIQSWRAAREGGFAGASVNIGGLDATLTEVLVQVRWRGGNTQTTVLTAATPEFTFPVAPAWYAGLLSYFDLGLRHILLGIDHLLFVMGLLLIVPSRMMLFKTITAFTIAHSITLAIATFGLARAPVAPLNAAIALSILFLGPEIVRHWRGETSFTLRHPWVVAFLFGLLHGFGFASGLMDLGLPQGELAAALLLFNVGVEAGQIGFVILVFALLHSFAILEVRFPRWMSRVPGYAVGSLGAFWTIQRVAMLI